MYNNYRIHYIFPKLANVVINSYSHSRCPGTVGESLSTSSGNQHGSGTTLSPNGNTNQNGLATSPTPGNRGGATNSPTTDRANVSQHGSLTSQRAANGGVLSTSLTGNVIALSSTRPGGLYDSPTTRSIFSNCPGNGFSVVSPQIFLNVVMLILRFHI